MSLFALGGDNEGTSKMSIRASKLMESGESIFLFDFGLIVGVSYCLLRVEASEGL